ncbi:DUF1152 domain-containing protein [Nocardia salmonicida]|uniref:DUF1152 domain-containing protein n=1 Tax=Nocardia salmonicida TaxID=53431 RepID=UPI0007A458FC|nr:DUF1152 domain-containing protein [Nocardia salmonicida]MBC7299539.1 DUF1152 domain-containing protein [Nocardia sp.]
MRTAVMFAAGGGGDAVTATMLARALSSEITVTAIMSWSWDRLLVDPLPGPRSADDFHGLIAHGDGLHQVPSTATLTTGGESTLPRLASHLDPMPLLLADPRAGAFGLSRQLQRAADVFSADLIVVVDAGGDILAAGDEPGLRSPLADSLALAAAVRSTLPTHVLVTGLGLDGELTVAELDQRLVDLDAHELSSLGPREVVGLESIWAWHPSEANALLALAASGWRGRVESQRETTISVDSQCTAVFRVDPARLTSNSIAKSLTDTTSLDSAEQAVRRLRGFSDIDIERRRLHTRSQPQHPGAEAIAHLDLYAAAAVNRGIDALTTRRVLELSAATDSQSTLALRQLLEHHRPNNFRPPLYLTSSSDLRR